MGRRKNPQDFIKRAQQKGSEENKKHINSSKIQKSVNNKTRNARKKQGNILC